MASSNGSGPYGEYMDGLWDRMAKQPEPSALSHLVAAEACYLQVPDAEAATARPDMAQIDRWSAIIEGTKAFERLWDSPTTDQRIESRDAEGLMLDYHAELTGRSRGSPEPQPERERTVEQKQPQRGGPDGPIV